MKRKAFALTFIGVVILLSVETFFTGLASANFTPLPELPTPIYIRGDGTIEGGAGALQRSGNIYTFVRDINETIEIQKDNVIIDGNGFSLTKPPEVKTDALMTPIGWFPSIKTSNKKDIIIKDIKFDKCYTSIAVKNSSNIIIIQNTMKNGNEGIYMSSCTNCSIIGNEIVDNSFTGLDIMDSSFLNIAYNTISRNHFHGGWIAVSFSNISRNDITDNSFDNFGIGLYLYGPNSNNRIFENNFINNEIGLFYQGARGSSVNNKVYSNYWSNYQDAIVNVAADSASGVDQSPLTNPISTSFDPSLFPWLSPTPTASPLPNAESNSEPSPTTLGAAASVATVAVVGAGLLIYFKKRKR
jgi:parallel beta-helix repeat protein